MAYLKIHRDEPETEAPAPLSFERAQSSWRSTDRQADDDQGSPAMDSIRNVELALGRVDDLMEDLSEQVEELCEPMQISDWMPDENEGPWVA